jgi:hypothetical protein
MQISNLLAQMKTVFDAIETLPESCWESIVSLTRPKFNKKNDYFAQEGDRAKNLAFVCSGGFRAVYRNAEGIEYNKTFFLLYKESKSL